MKAITISQPYASLISNGIKFVENRTWETKYRGEIAIHSGKGTQYMTHKQMRENSLPFGTIVAFAQVQACVRRDWPDSRLSMMLPPWCSVWKFLDHEHTEGPWCWIIGDVRKLDDPIPAKGALGLWWWDETARMCG